MDTTPTETAGPLHFFAPPQVVRNKLLLVGLMLGAVIVIAVMASPDKAGAMFGYGLGLLLLCEAFVWGLLRFNRLTITDEGVRYRSAGLSVVTSWHNITRLHTQALDSQREVDGLLLREPGLQTNGCLMFLSWFDYSARVSFNQHEYFLPISNLLGNHWWTSPFADELRRRAPHLFTGATE